MHHFTTFAIADAEFCLAVKAKRFSRTSFCTHERSTLLLGVGCQLMFVPRVLAAESISVSSLSNDVEA